MAEAKQSAKESEGYVVSDRMEKTVVVEVTRLTRHLLYGKVLRKSRRFKAHDELNSCRIGDRVLIRQSRPLSKEKRWQVVKILERAH
jgi:small subunit ribosomal protein S17